MLSRLSPKFVSKVKFAKRTTASVYFKNSYSTDIDRDLLHKSILPTDYFQPSLPRLPIPKLDKTCDRYLSAVRPILSGEDYARTEATVVEFHNGKGKELQKELIALDRRNRHTSYITGPWFDMYLESRTPLVLNYNPFMVFTDDPKPEYQNQLIRATNMIISSLRYMKTYRANVLEPEIFHLNQQKSNTDSVKKFIKMLPRFVGFYAAAYHKAFPLDMSQYKNLFNSTRIPRHGKDELFTNESAKHLLVMRNGHFYIFDVLDRDGYIIPADAIKSHLQYILQDNRPPPEFPVAVLTAENRDKWATCREQLLNAGNEMELQMIDSAVFALVLDDVDSKDPNEVTRTFLHGDGANRWFDKCFQLIIEPSGLSCVNFEHSWGDGVAVLRYFNEVFKDSTENPRLHPSAPPANIDSSKIVQRLDFKLDPHLKESITSAKQNFDKLVGSLHVDHLEYNKFTKKYVKEKQVSPDSIMQLAIQMTYFRQYNKFVGTYESCSTAAFKHGRTEVVRPCTYFTQDMCQMMLRPGSEATAAEMRESIDECSKCHSQLTKEAAMGQGFDRHLFGLKHVAEKKGEKPAIFQDRAYKKLNHYTLSTSTISSDAVLIGGFGPVVPDGYGIGYAIENNRIGFNVTSYLPDPSLRDFVQGLKLSLDDIYEVLEGRRPKHMS